MLREFVLFTGLLIAGFSGHSHAEPENLSFHKQALVKYFESGEYRSEIQSVANKAQQYIALKVTQNNQLSPSKRKKLAIVFDIDETVLSNYPQMVKRDFGGGKEAIDYDIELGKDTAIKPMLALYLFAKQNRVALFFITGRKNTERWVTIKNLKAAGFSGWNKLVMKPLAYHQPSIAPYKTAARKEIAKMGYQIIASFGDQRSDLDGGSAGRPFKLPNPFYFLP